MVNVVEDLRVALTFLIVFHFLMIIKLNESYLVTVAEITRVKTLISAILRFLISTELFM